jgi:hypothetical protein
MPTYFEIETSDHNALEHTLKTHNISFEMQLAGSNRGLRKYRIFCSDPRKAFNLGILYSHMREDEVVPEK